MTAALKDGPAFTASRARRTLIPLAIAFVVLDLAALALLGPVSPADTIGDIAGLYEGRRTAVLASRAVHSTGLVVAFAFFGLLVGRMRESDEGTLSRIAFGGFVALVPIEIVRNVMFSALALRFSDFGETALPLHVIAVMLGPAIAFPVTASIAAIGVLRRSTWIVAVAALWLLSTVRFLTLSTVVWYAGLVAFVGLLAVVVSLAVTLSRAD